MTRLDCEAIADHHSDDRVTVWHGTSTPWRMCGYHATYHFNAETTAIMRARERARTGC